jgi:hypothetical protein
MILPSRSLETPRFPTAAPPRPPADPVAQTEIEFLGYGEDCVIVARMSLAAERLTDLLNEHDHYRVIDVLAESLADGTVFDLPEIDLRRDELMLVHATGPRGNPGRRQRTRQHALVAQVGPYLVHGYFHGVPGADPLDGIRRRKAMVPLTEASIEFVSGGALQKRRVDTLILNRELMDWVVEAEQESVEFPELEGPVATGRLVKDFTGVVLGHHEAA